MKVLLINGSPHEKGCTYTALSEVQKEIDGAGIETELFHIGSKAIRGCIGCDKCSGVGRCIFSDDCVNTALEKVEQADGLILGCPVHYASANGAFVSFLDRLFFAGNCFAYKPGACVTTARRAGTTCTLDVLNKYFTISNMPIVSSQYWNMVHGSNSEQVKQDLEGLQIMRTLGKNMVWMLRSIEAGKKAGILPPKKEAQRMVTNFIR